MRLNSTLRTSWIYLTIAFSIILLIACSRQKAPVGSLDYFRQNLKADMDLDDIEDTFGEAMSQTKSTVSVYKYKLLDSTEVWIGYRDKIVFACFVDKNHNLVEDLVHVESTPL